MPNINFDLRQSLADSNMYGYNVDSPLTEQAYYSGFRAADYAYDYDFIDFFKDAKHALYRMVQDAEMQEAADKMLVSKRNQDDINELLNAYGQLPDTDPEHKAELTGAIFDATERLKKNGVIKTDDDVNTDNLRRILDINKKNYEEALSDYQHNERQLMEDYGKHDISQYYNRVSNEQVASARKMLFSLPATMGSSMASPFLQTTSMAAGIAGAKGGAALGAVVGAFGGPAGAAIGAGIGGVIGGALGGWFGGGQSARENESHMEAFGAYKDRVYQLAKKENLDLQPIIQDVKKQLNQEGVDTTNYTDDAILQRLLVDQNLVSGSSTFDRIAKDAYLGTRRVYEMNNALGVGEVISDLTYAIPAGKLFSPIIKGIGKVTNKITANLIKRFSKGVDVAKMGSYLRNERLFKEVASQVAGLGIRGTIEATEEGAQHIIADRLSKGYYDDQYANESILDSFEDGQVFSDILENTMLRARSLGAVFNLDPEYSNDQQMMESMLSGFILPVVSPQGIIGQAHSLKESYDRVKSSKKVGDYFAANLAAQDQIARNQALFKVMREGIGSENYNQVLDRIQNQFKNRDENGIVNRYNLNLSVLTEDGSVPTDQDIDDYFNNQREEYDKLAATRKGSAKKLKALKLSGEDQDTYLSLLYNAEQDWNIAVDENKQNISALQALTRSIDVSNIVTKLKLPQGSNEAVKDLMQINAEIDAIDNILDSSDIKLRLSTALTKRGTISPSDISNTSRSIDAYLKEKSALLTERKLILGTLKTQGVSQENIEELTNERVSFDQLEDSAKYQTVVENTVQSQALQNLLKDKSNKLKNGNKEYIRQQIVKYRQTVRQQEKLADNANAAARNNTVPTIPTNLYDDTKLVDKTKEQIDEFAQQRQQELSTQVEQFKQLVNNIPEGSFLNKIKQQVDRYTNLATNDQEYARSVSRLMKRLSDTYSTDKIKDKTTEQERVQLKQLQTVADHLGEQMDNLLRYATEQKAKAERHSTSFQTNSSVYTDTQGNRYVFDMSKAEYSENEGLILHLRPADEIKDIETDELVKNLENRVKELNETEGKSEEDKTRDRSLANSLQGAIDQLRESSNKRQEIVLRADDPLLQELTTKDNAGNVSPFVNTLNRYNETVSNLIQKNKSHRNMKTQMAQSEGDVETVGENLVGFKARDERSKVKQGGLVKPKAYPLKDAFGIKQASKLLNPYHKDAFWHGYITMGLKDAESAKKSFSEKDAAGNNQKRVEAVSIFHRIGGQIAYAKQHDKFNTENIFKPLRQLITGEADKVKIMGTTLTKEEWDKMVWALPLKAVLYSGRTGRQATTVYFADFASRNYSNTPSASEIAMRTDYIANLLLSYRRPQETSSDEEVDGMPETKLDRVLNNSIRVENGDVQLTVGGFNYNTTTQTVSSSIIFQDEEGNQMSDSQINELYDSRLEQYGEEISDSIDGLVVLAQQLGYEVNKQDLEKVDENGVSNAIKLITAIVKYGDGRISLEDTLLPNYIRPILGLNTKTTEKRKIGARNRDNAVKLLEYIQNNIPELFISYRNYQDENQLTPPVNIAVEQAMNRKRSWFNQEGSIRILKPEDGTTGRYIDTTYSEENVAQVKDIMNRFEQAIRESRTADEFLASIKSMGYEFELKGNKQAADTVLKEYFNNRRFQRLRQPTNIVHAITEGTSTPLKNPSIDYSNLNRRTVHRQGSIAKVSALGITKDENGRYVFSIKEFIKNNITGQKDTEEKQPDELETAIAEREELYDNYSKELDAIRSKSNLINWIQEKQKTFDEDQTAQLLRTNKKGETVLKIDNIGQTRGLIKQFLSENLAKFQSEYAEQYAKTIQEQIEQEDDQVKKGKGERAISFAYASYDGSIIYFDDKGVKHTMMNAQGTAGNMYLIIPAFLTPFGRDAVAKLNPKKLDDKSATFIADLFLEIVRGKSPDTFANDITTEHGFKVNSSMSIKSLLESLVYIGKEAVINNPVDNNYKRLLYFDTDGSVRFGDNENVLSEETYNEFVEFLKQYKTFRVDRNLAGDYTATINESLSVTDSEGNVMMQYQPNDNYVSYIIDNQILTTDLDPNKKARIFSKPSLYFDCKLKYNFVTPPPANDPNAEGSATNSKKKVQEMATRDEVEETLQNESTTKIPKGAQRTDADAAAIFEKTLKGFVSFMKDLLTKRTITGNEFVVKYVNKKDGKVYAQQKFGVVLTDEGDVQLDYDDGGKLIKRLYTGLKLYKQFNLIVCDADGNPIEQDGKPISYTVKNVPKKTESQPQTATPQIPGDAQGALNWFLQAIFQAAQGQAPQMGTAQPMDVPTVPTAATPGNAPVSNAAPIGFVGLGKPVQKEAEQASDPRVEKPSIVVTGEEFTLRNNGIEVQGTKEDTWDDIESRLAEADEDGLMTDEEFDKFKELFDQAKSQIETGTPPAQPAQGGGVGWGAQPTPASRFLGPTQAPQAAQGAESAATAVPTFTELLGFTKTNKEAQSELERADNIARSNITNKDSAVAHYQAAFAKYLQGKGMSRVESLQFVRSNKELNDSIRDRLYGRVFTGSILNFLNEHVQKEDFDSAMARAETILGKDFDLNFLSDTPKVWDQSRHAMIYVFGQCASSGIRLFRDANNQIAKGSLYHEAFHRISLFILSKEERAKMYQHARESWPETVGMNDFQIEEFLADRFADFVNDAEQRKQGKYYSSNRVFKFFQKIFDKIAEIINRLTSHNITPRYVNMNKLFQDMYSGRYAYAKATSENIEEFDKLYSGFGPYTGFKVNGVEIANNVQQYHNIYRDLVGRAIRTSNLLHVQDGSVNVSMAPIKAQIQADLVTYQKALMQLDKASKMDLSKTPGMQMYSKQDIDYAILQMLNLIDTSKSILQNWEIWSEVVGRDLNRRFNAIKHGEDKPDEIANEEVVDGGDGLKVPQSPALDNTMFSKNRDSYMTNIFDAADISMKMLLWSITEYDANDPNSAKFTPEGLLEYTDVNELYVKIIYAIQGAVNIQDMMDKLKNAADKEVKDNNYYGLMQVYNILNNPDTSQAIINRFFTDFVRYVHQFQNFEFTNNPVKVGDTYEPRYDATVKSSNTDMISQKLNNKWKSQMMIKMAQLSETLTNTDSSSRAKKFNAIKDQLHAVIKQMKRDNIPSIEAILIKLNELFGVGMITGDVTRDARLYNALFNRNPKQNALLGLFNSIKLLSYKDLIETKDNKQGYKSVVEKMFAEKSILTNLAQTFGDNIQANPKTISQRGPGNTKIYPVGSYNFITRLFDTRMKTKEWQDQMSLNPYSSHSRWLANIIAKGTDTTIRFSTNLGTVLDSNYRDSVADIDVTPTEELLNRFTATLSGGHPIPSLANKRFAGCVYGVPQFSNMFDADGNINPTVIDAFVGYMADEILAISDAMYIRNEFMRRFNKATNQNFTAEQFSKLSSTEQQEYFMNNPQAAKALGLLVKTYHFVDGDAEFIQFNEKFIMRRAFHIDLTKGSGYKFRHFAHLASNFNLTESQINSMSSNSLTDNPRDVDAEKALALAKRYRGAIVRMLNSNIAATINKMIEAGIIIGPDVNIETGQVDAAQLVNKYLPKDVLYKYLHNTNNVPKTVNFTGQQIYNAIGFFTVQDMSDNIEFEKLVSGDIGYHKNIDSVNKRYSGIVSTYQITAERGTMPSAYDTEDRLLNSPTYRTIELNTSKVANYAKFVGDMRNALGVDIVVDIHQKVEDGKKKDEVVANVNERLLLDENGNFTEQAKKGSLIQRYIDHRNAGRRYGLDKNGNPLSDEQLAKRAVKDALNRFGGYLNNDPTDAAAFITPEMFRGLKQREGKWNDVNEASHDLLENFDRITTLSQNAATRKALQNTCRILNIDYDDLLKRSKAYDTAVKNGDEKTIRYYKGFIINSARELDATSLKYVYYGDTVGREDHLVTPTYDKFALIPVYKIFADGHQMKEVYNLMQEMQVDMLKMESSVKSGGSPSFELFDKNGNIDARAIHASVVREQRFELLGKQLNTDPHHTTEASLLTQFMKVAVMNVDREGTYNYNGKKIKGQQLIDLYKSILDELTDRGYRKFRSEFGITYAGLDKTKFMQKLQEIAVTQGLPADTIDAFATRDGKFIIHPTAMPNVNFLQSRIIAAMGDTIIETTTPGQPLYQQPSVGYDNIFNIEKHADKHLLMPGEIDANGNVVKRMQVKLSINFFSDVLKKAKEAGVEGYDFDNFEDQRRFILENQELLALSYRVPTQGQNSTIPVEIVDVFPPQKGGVIMFPAGITALTGSDFDIDKMFLARYNYEVYKGKLQKVRYKTNEVLNNTKHCSTVSLQNALLDIYQAVLTDSKHYLAANTPLDVCTAPLKQFAQNEINSEQGTNLQKTLDGYDVNPSFQTEQKEKNSGSDNGIGPMALNSVFRFFVQVSNLKLRPNKLLKDLGIDSIDKVFDQNGEDILDVTSALINAHVDAVKDNYIGKVNVNGYSFDVTSLLVSTGFGNDSFAFLSQPILKQVAKNWMQFKNGHIGVSEDQQRGSRYLDIVKSDFEKRYESKLTADEVELFDRSIFDEPATKDEMQLEYMINQINNPTDTKEWLAQQLRYLNTFLELKDVAEGYSAAIRAVQVDTKKYGISANDLISFMQAKEQLESNANLTFINARQLFDNTFLGDKYDKGIQELFETFNTTILEFSQLYIDYAYSLCRKYGRFGRFSKEFLRRVGPKIKTVLFAPFFAQYLVNRFDAQYPLHKLVAGSQSVPSRLMKIREKCIRNNEGVALFNILQYNPSASVNLPQFMLVDPAIRDNELIRSNVQAAMSELFESDDAEVRQWMNDFAVYMFYLTGGSDANAGGMIKTTLYDLLPPQHLANLSVRTGNGSTMTFNEYVTDLMSGNGADVDNTTLDWVMRLVALTDDNLLPLVTSGRQYSVTKLSKDGSVITIKKGSNNLRDYSTNKFIKFIKIRDNENNTTTTYQLGDVAVVKYKDKEYQNPIYYKVGQLGYRNLANPVFSVRADGYVTEDGTVRSLLQQTPQFTATQFSELDGDTQRAVEANLGDVVSRVSAEQIENLPSLVTSENTVPDYIMENFAYNLAIDMSDTVYYINDKPSTINSRQLLNYADMKGREIHIISSVDEEIPAAFGKKVTILGVGKCDPTIERAIVDKVHENGQTLVIAAKDIYPTSTDYDYRQLQLSNDDIMITSDSQYRTTSNSFRGYVGGFSNEGKGTTQGDGKDKAMRRVADGFVGELSKSDSSTSTSLRSISGKTGNSVNTKGVTVSTGSNPTVVMLARNSEFKGKQLSDTTKQAIKQYADNGARFVVGDMPGVDSQFIDYLQEIGANFTIYHSGNNPRINIQNTNELAELGKKRKEQCK